MTRQSRRDHWYEEAKAAYELLKNSPVFEPEIYYKSSEQMSEVEDNTVQLIVTSPPYNVGKEYGVHDDSMKLKDYRAFLDRVWKECKRVLCKGGRIAVNVANIGRQPYFPLDAMIISQFKKYRLLMRGEIIWDKGPSVGVSTAWGSWRKPSNPTLRDVNEKIILFEKNKPQEIKAEHEHILVYSKGSYRLESENNIATISPYEFTEYTKSIWRFPTASPINNHPAPFPDDLPKRLIQLYTYLGDTVLDPFLGSGTTCKVAKMLGRKSIGYEIDESYRAIINRRISEARELAIPLDTFVPKQIIDDFAPDDQRSSSTNSTS